MTVAETIAPLLAVVVGNDSRVRIEFWDGSSLGPAPGKRSRGELPLLALRDSTAAAAASAIAALPAAEWRPFNMVVADRHGGIFLRGEGSGRPEALPLPPGPSVEVSAVTWRPPSVPGGPCGP